MLSIETALAALAEGFGCLLAADFISGLIHWAEDTWSVPGRSALLDAWIVRDNIEHHRRPGTIRSGTYWSTNRVTLIAAALAAAALAACGVTAWGPYAILALVSHANQVHLWAHSSRVPWAVGRLQSIGVLQSSAHHARHHRSPYAERYCAFTNFLNPMLDGAGFWRAIERALTACGATVQRGSLARGGY